MVDCYLVKLGCHFFAPLPTGSIIVATMAFDSCTDVGAGIARLESRVVRKFECRGCRACTKVYLDSFKCRGCRACTKVYLDFLSAGVAGLAPRFTWILLSAGVAGLAPRVARIYSNKL